MWTYLNLALIPLFFVRFVVTVCRHGRSPSPWKAATLAADLKNICHSIRSHMRRAGHRLLATVRSLVMIYHANSRYPCRESLNVSTITARGCLTNIRRDCLPLVLLLVIFITPMLPAPDFTGILPREPVATRNSRTITTSSKSRSAAANGTLANRTRFLQAYLDRSQSWVDPGSTGSSSAPSYEAYGHHNYAMTVRIKPDETSVELVRHQRLQSSQHVTALRTSPCGSSFGTLVSTAAYAIEIGVAHDSFRVYL